MSDLESGGPQSGSVMQRIDAFFRISARGSTFKNEIKGGIITFLAMVFILVYFFINYTLIPNGWL